MTNEPEWAQLLRYTGGEFTHEVGHKWWYSLGEDQRQELVDDVDSLSDTSYPGVVAYIRWRKRKGW